MVSWELEWSEGDPQQCWFELKCLWESSGFNECLVPNRGNSGMERRSKDNLVHAARTEDMPYPLLLNWDGNWSNNWDNTQ